MTAYWDWVVNLIVSHCLVLGSDVPIDNHHIKYAVLTINIYSGRQFMQSRSHTASGRCKSQFCLAVCLSVLPPCTPFSTHPKRMSSGHIGNLPILEWCPFYGPVQFRRFSIVKNNHPYFWEPIALRSYIFANKNNASSDMRMCVYNGLSISQDIL